MWFDSFSAAAALDQLFSVIQLFSPSLITLSLDFNNMYLMNLKDVLLNGVELEKSIIKTNEKITKNFYFYIGLGGCKDVEQILSTFQTFSSSIAVHENPYLHELKYFRHFRDVRSNNTAMLKDDHRLWSNVRSLQLVHSEEINFESLFPLIKLHMPKLSSITLRGKNDYNSLDDTDNCNAIERVRVQLDSVTSIRLEEMSREAIEQIKQILIYSFPNLQCLILHYTKLLLKENELTLFLGQKLQQIEVGEYSLQERSSECEEEKDFSYLFNLKYVKLTYGGVYNDEELNNQRRTISNLLTKLETFPGQPIRSVIPGTEIRAVSPGLSIYAMPGSGCFIYDREQIFNSIIDGLNQDEMKTKYETKRSGKYLWFIQSTVSGSC